VLKLWRDVGRDTRWVLVSYMLWGVGEGLWLYMQPLYVKSLGATPAQTGLVMGMWGLARLVFILPAGFLADRWASRRVMLPGWYLGLAGVVMIALAPDWRWAAPGFLVYGISALAIPVTNLYIAQSFRHDPTRRPDLPLRVPLTMLWAAYSIGLVFSPSVGGLIGELLNLRAVFLISVFWFVLSTLAILRTHAYPVPVRPHHGYDYRGLFSRWQPFALVTLAFTAMYIGQTLSPQYLEEVRDFSRTWIGAFGSINALGTAVFSLLLGRLSSLRGFFVSLLIVIWSFAILLLTGSWPLVAWAYFMLGAYNTTRPLAVSLISERVGEHQRGMAYALIDTLAGLAALVGMNLAGGLYAENPDRPFIVAIIGIIGVGALMAILLPARNVKSVPTYSGVEQS
jgi:MFS family permease